jgi:hypothetical protein
LNKFLIYLIILILIFNFGFVSYVFANTIPDYPKFFDDDINTGKYYDSYIAFFSKYNVFTIRFFVLDEIGGLTTTVSSSGRYFINFDNSVTSVQVYQNENTGEWYVGSVNNGSKTAVADANSIVGSNITIPGPNGGPPLFEPEPDSFVYDFDLKEGAIFDIKKPPICSLEVIFTSVGSLSFKRSQVFGSEYFNPTNWDLIMEETVTTDSIINLHDGITRFKITDVVNPEAIRLKAIACPGESFPTDPDNPGSVISPPGLGPNEYVTRNIPEGKSLILDNFTNNSLPITINYKPKNIIVSGALYVSWHTNYLDEWIVYNDTQFGGPKSITKKVPVLKGDRIIFSNQSGSHSITYPDKSGVEFTIVDDMYLYNIMNPSTDSDKIDDNWSPGTIDNPNYNNNPYGPGGNVANFELSDFNRSMLDSFGAVQDMSGNVFTYFATGLSWIPTEWLLLGTLSLTIGLLAFIFGRK